VGKESHEMKKEKSEGERMAHPEKDQGQRHKKNQGVSGLKDK
jgi:hypothetical protein